MNGELAIILGLVYVQDEKSLGVWTEIFESRDDGMRGLIAIETKR